MSSVICCASSLVGAITKPSTFPLSGSSFSSIGTPKDAVLPVPVLACPMTFFPSSIGGMAFSCIGNISLNPRSSSAFLISGLIVKSLNFIVISLLSWVSWVIR